MPNKHKGKSPMELMEGVVPDPTRFHIFGCLVVVYVPKQLRRGPASGPRRIPAMHKAEFGVFMGYTAQRIARIYSPRTQKVTNHFHVRFFDTIIPGLTIDARHINPFLNVDFFPDINDSDTEVQSTEIAGGDGMDWSINNEIENDMAVIDNDVHCFRT